MKFYIRIHSIVDVITNSSSVIYTEARDNSITLAKKIINSVLTVAGSEKTADDIFNFKVLVYPTDISDYIENHEDDETFMASIPDVEGYKKANDPKVNGKMDYAARRVALNEWEKKNKEALMALFTDESGDLENGLSSTLIVTTKDGVDIEFAKNALALFDIEASYDG